MFDQLISSAANSRRRLSGSLTLAMLLLGAAFGASAQVVYTYDNTTVGALSNAATPCATPLARTFVVTDAFTVGHIAVGVDIDHINRGDLRMTLPSGLANRTLPARRCMNSLRRCGRTMRW